MLVFVVAQPTCLNCMTQNAVWAGLVSYQPTKYDENQQEDLQELKHTQTNSRPVYED